MKLYYSKGATYHMVNDAFVLICVYYSTVY